MPTYSQTTDDNQAELASGTPLRPHDGKSVLVEVRGGAGVRARGPARGLR